MPFELTSICRPAQILVVQAQGACTLLNLHPPTNEHSSGLTCSTQC